jgi:hypothetical protein
MPYTCADYLRPLRGAALAQHLHLSFLYTLRLGTASYHLLATAGEKAVTAPEEEQIVSLLPRDVDLALSIGSCQSFSDQ